jgi:hypothetical protein
MRLAWWSLAVILLVAVPARAERMKLAVLPTQFDKNSTGLVPKLFDEYVLTAVQNAGEYEVIGQDDIAALVGFEKQKDVLGCDDASCIANIGGALGVDRIVAIKIARLDPDWVVTSKLINIRATKVEARTSDMVAGSVKNLLNAVPDIVNKLFAAAQGRTPPRGSTGASSQAPTIAGATGTSSQAPTTASSTGEPLPRAASTSPPATAGADSPGPEHGRVARVAGIILTVGGVACMAFSLGYGYLADGVKETTYNTGGTQSAAALSTTNDAGATYEDSYGRSGSRRYR